MPKYRYAEIPLSRYCESFIMQSYEKSSEIEKENLFFFSFPRHSNFGEAKVTKSRAK